MTADKQYRLSTAIVFLALMGAFGCRREPPVDPAVGELARHYPRVDGSTSTHPLSVLVACRIRGVPYRWEMRPASERTVEPNPGWFSPVRQGPEERIDHTGTHGAYERLAKGEVDLILVARPPSANELQHAAVAGVAFDATPIAKDALVIVVNAGNPLPTLGFEQIRAIFGIGKLPSWKELGGGGGAIEPFHRQVDSGSRELLEKWVMKGGPLRAEEEAPLVMTMAGAVNVVAMNRQAICYSVYYYVRNMARNPAARLVAVEGVFPTAETIASGSYPLVTDVLAVARAGGSPDSPATRLRDWLLTDGGRQAIAEAGYVPVGK
jgi:phosphate transport system substrate-binding protein